MRYTSAIRSAKARKNDRGFWQSHRRLCPIALSACGALGYPYLHDAGAAKQIVHVPVQALVGTEMALQPSCQSSGAERTADIEIKTGGEAESSPPANVNNAWAVERDDERVGAGPGQRVCCHCQIKPVIQIRPLPINSNANPTTSA